MLVPMHPKTKGYHLRVIFQVLFFEQMQLRTALASYLHVLDAESAPAASVTIPNEMSGQRILRDGWVTIVRENHVLKADSEWTRLRVGELEEEFCKIKEDMKMVTKSHSYLRSPHFFARRIGCNLLGHPSNAQTEILESTTPTPRASVKQARPSTRHAHHRKSYSPF